MNSSTYFRDWLYTAYKPCILVYSSEKVKQLFNKNNLTPADFLRPLGDFKGRQITYPFNDKENLNIPNLRFDFFDSDKFLKIQRKDIFQYIITMFNYNQPKWDLSTPTVNKIFKEPYLNKTKYNSTIWYREYEKTIFECLQFNDYEFLQQPFINIYMCAVDEPVSIIKDELAHKKNLAKLISEEKYENPKENIIIIVNEKKKKEEKKEENKEEKKEENQEEKKEEKDEEKNAENKEEKNAENKEEKKENERKRTNEENIKKFISTYNKNYYVIYWEVNKNSEETNETSELFMKYFHRTDLYNPKNDFYRRNGTVFGKYITKNDVIEYREDFFKYITNVYLNSVLLFINDYNNIIKQKRGGFNFFKASNKALDRYYPVTNIYMLNEVERSYYNLGLIYFYFRQYNYATDNFKSYMKSIKDKSPEHRNRLQELLMIIRFLLIYNTKKDFDIFGEAKKLPKYFLEQEIKMQFLIIKMLENNFQETQIKPFINSLIFNIENFVKLNKPSPSHINILTCFDYSIPLFYEKICIYLLKSNKIRNFAYYMSWTSIFYNALYKEMKPYVLFSLSQLLFVLDKPNQSFIIFRQFFNEMFGMNCNEIKYYEGALKFFRNCLEFSYLNNVNNQVMKAQNVYLNFYINNTSKIVQEKIICENININDICVPIVDNRSLFILEENDYLIKKQSEMILESERKWEEFLKYNVKLLNDPYNDLDENDINHVKFLNDMSNNIYNPRTNVSTKISQFNGYTNQKLYVQFTMTNPLTVDLIISSIKLLCDFVPEKEETPNNTSNKVPYICSEEKINLSKFQTIKLTLYVQALIPGKITVKGLEILLFKDCKVINYFNKKSQKLYKHRRKSFSSQGSDMSNSSDRSSQSRKSISDKIIDIYSKRIIEYIVKDYNTSLYVDFPMGLDISLYLYQFLMYPIVFTNKSDKNRVKRITIFIENCNNKKLFHFFDYITKEIHINPDNPTTKIYIPILPILKDDLYIKLLIKFSDEKRIKPIAVKPFIIKINVKRSVSFEFKENYYNYFSLNNDKNIMDIQLKADLTLKESSDMKNITLKEPILNKKYILLNTKNNETNDNKKHLIYNIEANNKYTEEIPQEENSDDDEEEKIKKRDYSKIIKTCGFFLENDEGKNVVDLSNNHIYEKFNDMIINSDNNNIIIFPFEGQIVPEKNETNEAGETKETKENKIMENKQILKGIYIYGIKLKNQNISKNYLRELFYNSTKLEPVVKKINEEKNLVVINISINKSGLVALGKDIDKYDIFIDENSPFITWFGPNKFTVMNEIKNENDAYANLKFTFYTKQKGMIEINKIFVLLYKKFEGMEFSTGMIQINHISKPLYLNLE